MAERLITEKVFKKICKSFYQNIEKKLSSFLIFSYWKIAPFSIKFHKQIFNLTISALRLPFKIYRLLKAHRTGRINILNLKLFFTLKKTTDFQYIIKIGMYSVALFKGFFWHLLWENRSIIYSTINVWIFLTLENCDLIQYLSKRSNK